MTRLLRDALLACAVVGFLAVGLLRWSTDTDAGVAVRADAPTPNECNMPPMLRP